MDALTLSNVQLCVNVCVNVCTPASVASTMWAYVLRVHVCRCVYMLMSAVVCSSVCVYACACMHVCMYTC